MSPSPLGRFKRVASELAMLALLAVAAGAPYANSLQGKFAYDDKVRLRLLRHVSLARASRFHAAICVKPRLPPQRQPAALSATSVATRRHPPLPPSLPPCAAARPPHLARLAAACRSP